MAREDFSLEHVGANPMERRKKKRERKEEREEEKRSEKLHLLSRIAGDLTVSVRRSKRESRSP